MRLLSLVVAASTAALADPAARCDRPGVVVQVLGSGGPDFADGRASASYLVWRDRAPLLLVDAGGGSAPLFARSGARVQDLRAVLLTHLHVDHSADLPALVKASYFEKRAAPLPVFGPAGSKYFPSTSRWLQALFGPRGAWRYLEEFTRGEEGGYRLEAHDLAPHGTAAATALDEDGLRAEAFRVVHGPVPALAFRVTVAGKVLAFSGDTTGEGALAEAARGADIFIAHHAIAEDGPAGERKLHMAPSTIGRIAAAAGVKRLVLSHRMGRTRGHEPQSLRAIAAAYQGPVELADDLQCFEVK